MRLVEPEIQGRLYLCLLFNASIPDSGFYRSRLDRMLLTVFWKVNFIPDRAFYLFMLNHPIILCDWCSLADVNYIEKKLLSFYHFTDGCILILVKEYSTIHCYMKRGTSLSHIWTYLLNYLFMVFLDLEQVFLFEFSWY